MDCVLDASTALAAVLPDERSGQAEQMLRRFSKNKDGRFLIPELWWHEVSNALLSAYRQKRLKEAEMERIAELLNQWPLRPESSSGYEFSRRHRALALSHRLSVYDCVYLELAERKGLPLATLDEEMRAAAKRLGISVL